MKGTLLALGLLLGSASLASAQAAGFGCPDGMPASVYPGPAFVPSLSCEGWVPANHPLARHALTPAPAPAPSGPPMLLAAQAVYSALEIPTLVSASAGGIRTLSGWALDCELGSRPPVMRIVEQKPDGSIREVPNDFFFSAGARPDVQASIRSTCPAVDNAPGGDGSFLGPIDNYGWSLALRSAVTEIGEHVFTAVWSWPSKGHAGSSSVTVRVIP